MSKLSFRARALDATKPMPIYYTDDVPEIQDFATINRAVPQMPTGMEKEEECEHHLQRAISAQQAYGHTGELVIPTPEVYNVPKHIKDELYPATYKSSRQLIHVQPFSMDQDIPDYDMDSEDERWLSQQAERLDIKPLQYEEMMDRLEKSSGQNVVTLKDAKLLLRDDDDIIIAVYDYWLNKRLKTQRPLTPQVRTEKRDGSTNNNPYVAFRRRTEKMQTRKNRKNDEASYEKMLKLRRDLSRAATLIELVKRREKTKREMLHLTVEIVEKRYQAQDFSGQMLAEVSAIKHPRQSFIPVNSSQVLIKQETRVNKSKPIKGAPAKKRQYKRKKLDGSKSLMNSHGLDLHMGDVSSEEEGLSMSQSDQDDDNDPDGPYAFRRKKNCNYHEPRLDNVGNWPWCSSQEGGTEDKRYRFCLTSVPGPHNRPSCIGFARKRIGRGGRIVFDRAWSHLDDHLSELDDIAVSTPNGLPSNNELLSEIRNEWKFFRPKPSSPSKEDSDDEPPPCWRRDTPFTQKTSIEGSVKPHLSQEDELFEKQRKQLERLKPIEEPVLVFVSDHSYATLPTSCFNVEPSTTTTTRLLSPVELSAELVEEGSSSVPSSSSFAAPILTDTGGSGVVDRMAINGPVVERLESGVVPREVVSFLGGVPSIDLPPTPSTADPPVIHTIKAAPPYTPHPSPSLLTFKEHNGNDPKMKQELFLSKVKIERVSPERSMDVT